MRTWSVFTKLNQLLCLRRGLNELEMISLWSFLLGINPASIISFCIFHYSLEYTWGLLIPSWLWVIPTELFRFLRFSAPLGSNILVFRFRSFLQLVSTRTNRHKMTEKVPLYMIQRTNWQLFRNWAKNPVFSIHI